MPRLGPELQAAPTIQARSIDSVENAFHYRSVMNPFDSIAPFYDLEHDGLTLDTTMYASMAKQLGSEILVMGAGTGRVVLALAKAGFHVWGVDNSPGMFRLAERKLVDVKRAHMIRADAINVDLDRSFDLVVVPLDTFALFQSAT